MLKAQNDFRLLISMTVLAFNLLGDGLRDALDARMRNTG